jgi:hypothetical protein
MNTIDEHQFRRFCVRVRQDAPAVRNVENPSERTSYLLQTLFEMVCQYLEIDAATQAIQLGDHDGYALFQTLEEHMSPEFSYTAVLDEELLFVP